MLDMGKNMALEMVRNLNGKSIALVGMMGSGKTTIGRIAAGYLDLPFLDADEEIEKAAGMSITDIFAIHGEAEFRAGERKIILRLLNERQSVLALGGGTFLTDEIRDCVSRSAVSVWLRVTPDVLYSRIARRPGKRPLLQTANPKATLETLLRERESCYAMADLTVEAHGAPKNVVRNRMISTIAEYLKNKNDRNE